MKMWFWSSSAGELGYIVKESEEARNICHSPPMQLPGEKGRGGMGEAQMGERNHGRPKLTKSVMKLEAF